MTSKYDMGTKGDKAETREALMRAAVEITDNRFTVAFQSDDTGVHACLYIECNPDGTTGFTERVLQKFMGWRVIHMNVPDGYIPVFFNEDGSKRATKESTGGSDGF